jgi:hypothetical protein
MTRVDLFADALTLLTSTRRFPYPLVGITTIAGMPRLKHVSRVVRIVLWYATWCLAQLCELQRVLKSSRRSSTQDAHTNRRDYARNAGILTF